MSKKSKSVPQTSPSGMATAAVDIAEEILKKAGFPATEPSAEDVPAAEGMGAAS